MSQSLSKLYIHLVFHTKSTSVNLLKTDFEDLFAYIGAIIKDNASIPIIINGVENHVHLLFIMSKNIALSKITEEIKRHSSRWLKGRGKHYQRFAWQGGYGGFSVSQSVVERTKRYIKNQEGHHKATNFREEYLKFLKEYDVKYDEQFLWRD